uniref:Uncharacterized protein n=1 Tax=Arundo donax TaxID=35708 RepID=A0A0A9FF11_ARUDO
MILNLLYLAHIFLLLLNSILPFFYRSSLMVYK